MIDSHQHAVVWNESASSARLLQGARRGALAAMEIAVSAMPRADRLVLGVGVLRTQAPHQNDTGGALHDGQVLQAQRWPTRSRRAGLMSAATGFTGAPIPRGAADPPTRAGRSSARCRTASKDSGRGGRAPRVHSRPYR